MFEDLLKTLETADINDFINCLKENIKNDSLKYYNMLMEIKYEDPVHYKALSNGCKAAMTIYFCLHNFAVLEKLQFNLTH